MLGQVLSISDYRGEVGVILFNHGDQDFQVKMGDRIAQLILEKIDTPPVEEVQGLGDTVRGSGGFGSTGVKGKNDTEVKKEMNDQKERTVEKEKERECKNETLKGSSSGSRTRTGTKKKKTEGTSRLSRGETDHLRQTVEEIGEKEDTSILGGGLGTGVQDS